MKPEHPHGPPPRALAPGELSWGPDGLLPVVTRDARTGDVLMLAYMSREAMDETLRSGRAVYFSRSRQALWPKGDTSGNVQRVRRVVADCDGDAVLLEVDQEGTGACHTGAWSCFHRPVEARVTPDPRTAPAGMTIGPPPRDERGVRPEPERPSGPGGPSGSIGSSGPGGLSEAGGPTGRGSPGAAVLDELAAVIADRHRRPRPGSYTSRLLEAAPDAILKKVAEEAGEVLLAAKNVEAALEAHGTPQALDEARAHLAWEAADLLYHLLVALQWAGVATGRVWGELDRRRQASAGDPGTQAGQPASRGS